MRLKRREALKVAAMAFSLPLLSACESIYSGVAEELGPKIPEQIGEQSAGGKIDPIFHLLSRAAYGPYPGDLEYAEKIGAEAWIDEQLNPEKINDLACEIRARRFETIHIPAGACYDFKKPSLRKDIVRHTLLRAVYSKRQVLEVMVDFWTDHLNISLDKGDCVYLKPSDDRLVIRSNALGKFSDLIKASALSPAMLVYLDGKENKKSSAADIPNENYARELLELHTMGVYGGYRQEDVYELARCLTGWRLHEDWERGKVYFDETRHDQGEKHLLGQVIPAGGGPKDLERALKIACAHPSTADYVSSKLCKKFISEPSVKLCKDIAGRFKSSQGDVKVLLKSILLSEEFQEDRGTKFKRPFRFLVSSLRALAADTHAHEDLTQYLAAMGQAPFQYPTPDGYPDDPVFWTGTLLWRWKFALALSCAEIESVKVDLDKLISSLGIKNKSDDSVARFFAYFVGRKPTEDELSPLKSFLSDRTSSKSQAQNAMLAGLIIASPAFQRY